MAKYILEEMLRVRNLRKDAAEKRLKQAQKLLDEAKQNLERAEEALEKFKVFIVEETDRLYKKIMMKKKKKGSVDELHYAIKVLKNKLVAHEQSVDAEKINLEKAEKNLEQKKLELQEANKNVEKIKSHKEEWMKESAKIEEMAADKELEEFAKKIKDA